HLLSIRRDAHPVPPVSPSLPTRRSSDLLFYGVIAVGVILLPVPAVGAHIFDAVLSHPVQLPLGLGGVCIALCDVAGAARVDDVGDRKSTRLNSSHVSISYAVFFLQYKTL